MIHNHGGPWALAAATLRVAAEEVSADACEPPRAAVRARGSIGVG